MDAVLYVECEKRKENFDYQGEISEDEYVKMLKTASESILGLDGFSKRNTIDKKYGFYDVSEMSKYETPKNDIEELPFRARIYSINGDDLELEHISVFWKQQTPFIIIVETDEIESPMVEDTLNIWITNSDRINNDETLNDRLILSSLQAKDLKLKVANRYFTLKYCKMVNKISFNKFALLVNNIEL